MSDVADKWGKPIAQRGFAQVPNYLLLLNQFLDEERRLSPVELLILLQLVGTWWVKTTLPFPSMKTLANRCGVSERQVQRAMGQLVKNGLVKRVNRRTKGLISSNAYDLAPLVAFLGDVAKAFPNEFPRNVDRATVKAISDKLEPPPLAISFSKHPIWDKQLNSLKILATVEGGPNHLQCLVSGLVFTDHFGLSSPTHEVGETTSVGEIYDQNHLGFEEAFRRMIKAGAYEPPSALGTVRVVLTADNFEQWFPDPAA